MSTSVTPTRSMIKPRTYCAAMSWSYGAVSFCAWALSIAPMSGASSSPSASAIEGVSILATSSPLGPATIGVDIGVRIASAIASNFRVLPPLRNENKPRSG